MKCKQIKEKIDSLVFESNDQSNLEVIVHIENCDSCKKYYEESLLSKKVISSLRNQEYTLKYPEIITDNILDRIENLDITDSSTKRSFTSKLIKIETIQRLLAAASVLLLVVFGYEQFIVIDKILSLEEQMSTSSNEPAHFKNYNEVIAFYPKQVTENLISTIKDRLSKKKNSKFRSMILLARLSKMDLTQQKQFLPKQSNEKDNNSTSLTKKRKER
ncbi:MAG: hypothetical protein R2750_04765 [Bacteroidales bacterium]